MNVMTGVLCGAAALLAVNCTRQAQAYGQSPVCRQAKNTCEHYEKTRKQAGSERGAALELLKEDCEASQRACAESVRALEPSAYPAETPTRSWRDFLK